MIAQRLAQLVERSLTPPEGGINLSTEARTKWKGRCRHVTVALLAVIAAAMFAPQPAEAATVIGSQIAGSRLYPGIDAYPGFRMNSPNGTAWFQVQHDGVAVLYENPSAPKALWHTPTQLYPGSYFALQHDDRNLVMIQPTPGGLVNRWAAGIRGQGASYLEIQDDKNLVAYREQPGGRRVAVWATHTAKGPGAKPAVSSKPSPPPAASRPVPVIQAFPPVPVFRAFPCIPWGVPKAGCAQVEHRLSYKTVPVSQMCSGTWQTAERYVTLDPMNHMNVVDPYILDEKRTYGDEPTKDYKKIRYFSWNKGLKVNSCTQGRRSIEYFFAVEGRVHRDQHRSVFICPDCPHLAIVGKTGTVYAPWDQDKWQAKHIYP